MPTKTPTQCETSRKSSSHVDGFSSAPSASNSAQLERVRRCKQWVLRPLRSPACMDHGFHLYQIQLDHLEQIFPLLRESKLSEIKKHQVCSEKILWFMEKFRSQCPVKHQTRDNQVAHLKTCHCPYRKLPTKVLSSPLLHPKYLQSFLIQPTQKGKSGPYFFLTSHSFS